MVTGQNRVFGCAANFLRGKKCVCCGSFKVNRTRRGYVKCRKCGKQKSLGKLRREITILQGFYQQVPAYRLAQDLAVDAKVVSRVYQKLRAAVFHVAELEAMESKLSGKIELDEAYFGGRRKGKRAAEGLLEKAWYSASWSVMGGSTPRSWRTSRPTRS